MRKRFEPQLLVGYKAINDFTPPPFYLRSRDEQAPIVIALHHIFNTPELNQKIFEVLEKRVNSALKNNGRPGMELWQILVLSILRHGLNCNWDKLLTVANSDQFVRQLLGVHQVTDYDYVHYEFKYQTLIDNVSLIDEETIYSINQIVTDYGVKLFKKKADELLELKTDSYVLEKNIHFPTDLNLLWDSMRKCFDMITIIENESNITGWRKIKCLCGEFKSLYRATNHSIYKGKKEGAKKAQVKKYLQHAAMLITRFEAVPTQLLTQVPTTDCTMLIVLLNHYIAYAKKFTNQIERRLLLGEDILSAEKIYSIFEPETEWITKGKMNKRVELGHLVLVTTNQHNLIVDYKIMFHEKDAAQVKPLVDRMTALYPGQIKSQSFDKGFWSLANYDYATAVEITTVVMPKKGKKNKEEQERESTKTFKQLRNQHSAIESTINMLEHHGANRCPDKGHKNYKRYFGLCVLATNLHLIGNQLLRIKKHEQEKYIKKAA